MGYHPLFIEILTNHHETGDRTVSGGQFDWGGRLPKVTEAPKGFLSAYGNRAKSAMAEGSSLRDKQVEQGRKSGIVIRGPEWKGHRSTDKSYLGITGISPKSPHRREVWHLDVGSSQPGAEAGPKGSAVRRLKRYVSWVQNVVRQFGPYPSWAQEI